MKGRLAPCWLAGVIGLSLTGCGAPGERLTFSQHPAAVEAGRRLYDVDGDGAADFALQADTAGRLGVLADDDDEDGAFDRTYDVREFGDNEVPHLIVLLDLAPFERAQSRFTQDDWTFVEASTRVIAPFPTISGVSFAATVDHEWPNMPSRVWDAFDGTIVSTPGVMLSIRDGWCIRDRRFAKYIAHSHRTED